MFWSLAPLLTQKPFMAVLREGEWLQSPSPMGLKTDPDGITEAGTILSPHIGSLESRQDTYKGAKRQKTTENGLPCTTSHSSAPEDSLVLSGPFLLNSFSKAEVFLLDCPVTIHTWQLRSQHLFSVLRQVISWCFLEPFFCSMSGSYFELQLYFAVKILQVFASFLPVQLNFCLGTTYSFLAIAHTKNAPWPEPQAFFRFKFCYTTSYLQRMQPFPCTYSNQKKTASFIPMPLLIPSLWTLLHGWASS